MVWELWAEKKPEQYYQRLYWVAAGIGLLLAVLAGRLVYMQVLRGEEFREEALNNSIRVVNKRAPRGLVLDRNLKVLVDNTPSLTLAVIPAELERRSLDEKARMWKRLSALIDRPVDDLLEKYHKHLPRPFAPVSVDRDIDRRLAAKVEELGDKLPGVVILQDTKRAYEVESAAHVLGYVGEITDRQLKQMREQGYRLGDLIGQTGVERVYDQALRGTDGGKQVRINSAGKELGLLNEVASVQGNNLVTTLDRDLQVVAEQALGRHAGSIIAMDPRNGEVLALASKPDFSLSALSGRVSARQWKKLLDDDRYPLSNRAIQGLYPPGSIFKVVTAAAGLHDGLVRVDEPKECLGIFWISTWPYRCWREIGHGYIGMHRSIVESCDIYYYQLGLKIKVDSLHDMAKAFGFGRETGIDLPNEATGLVPTAKWKEENQHMPWFPGNTVMMSIGQGYLLSTPIQLVMMASAVANGGVVYQPHLVKQFTNSSGQLLSEVEAKQLRRVDLEPDIFHTLREAMEGAVHERRGTAWRARVEGIKVAGKTGTAQNPHGEDHAAFVAFAPVDQPRIAVAVLVENGGEGGLTAAPMAQQVLAAFFGKQE